MKKWLLCFLLVFTLVSQQRANAQATEPVIGWSSWVNWPDFFADQGITANLSQPLTTSGGTAAVTFSDAGDGYGQRAFTTGWASGANTKAWKFQMTTTKFATLKFSCKMMGTNNFANYLGPRDFKLQYSLNGSAWVDVSGGTLTAGNGNGNFNSLTNIALPAACENQPVLYIRMVMTSNTSVTGAAVTGGQSHIDDLKVTGISNPEAPTDISLSNNVFIVQAGGTVSNSTIVGTFSSADFNLGNTFSYTLVAGTGNAHNGLFSVSGNTLTTASVLSPGVYNIRVRSTDNTTLYFEKEMTVTVRETDPINVAPRQRISAMGTDGNTNFNANAPAAIAYNSVNNEYFTVWQGDDNTGTLVDDEFEIFGQRTNANTGAAIGSKIRLTHMGTDGFTSYGAWNPSVAYNATNNEFLLVWAADHNSGSLTEWEYEIWGQRVNAATGAVIGSMFRISTMGPDGDYDYFADKPDITWNATTNQYLVVWQSDDNTSGIVQGENEIFAQLISNSGVLSGARVRVSFMGGTGNSSFAGYAPAVTWNAGSNEYFIVWNGDDNTAPLTDNEFEVFGQRMNSAGALLGSRIRISHMGPDGDTNYRGIYADVTWNSFTNEYLVVWQGDDNTAPLTNAEIEIFGQRITTAGGISGTRLRISDMGTDGNTAFSAGSAKVIYHAGLDEFWIVWQGNDNETSVEGEYETFMQRVTGAGAETGTNDIRVSHMGTENSTSFSANMPAIAYNSTNAKAFAVWQGDDNTAPLVDDEFEVFGQSLFIAGATLPVTWLSFTADKQADETVLLNWQTASEQHTRDFTVQHSSTGSSNWRDIGSVTAAGYSSTARDYTFVHNNPLQGKNYYRLLQTDIDGRSSYSRIASVDMNKAGKLLVYPNPATDHITVQLPVSGMAVIKLYSNEGQLINEEQYNGNKLTMNVQSLPAGLYHVKAQQQGNTYNVTFLKR